MILRRVTDESGGHYGYTFRCPGCDDMHTIPTTSDPQPSPKEWTFDGDENAPTFFPSILVYPSKILGEDGKPRDTPRCHSYVRAGKIQFLHDSTHPLAGQTVPLPSVDGK